MGVRKTQPATPGPSVGRISRDDAHILRFAAEFTTSGIAVYTFVPGEPWPRVDYANETVLRRAFVDRHSIDEAQRRALAGDERSFDCNVEACDGSRYWVECTVRRMPSRNDGCLRAMLVTRDVSDRKRSEWFESLLASAIEEQPDGVFIVRMDRERPLLPEIVYANSAFFRLTGYTREEVLAGRYPVILGERSDRNLIRSCVARVLQGEAVDEQVVLYRAGGTAFHAEVRAHLLDSPSGFCVLIIKDATERLAQRARLELLSEALERAGDFIIINDNTPPSRGGPYIVHVNQACATAMGYTAEELVGEPSMKLISPANDPAAIRAGSQCIERGVPNFREFLFRRKDGSDFWVDFASRQFDEPHGSKQYRISIVRDITLRKQATNQIALLVSAIEESRDSVIIYERDESGKLAVAYENPRSAEVGRYRLQELLSADGAVPTPVERQLLKDNEVRQVFAEPSPEGWPAFVSFSARSLRNASSIEAAITIERELTVNEAAPNGYGAEFYNLASVMPLLVDATTAAQRLSVLASVLRNAFDARMHDDGPEGANGDAVRIDAAERVAQFSFDGRRRIVRWNAHLHGSSLTALRFCIEAAIEHHANGDR